MNQFQLASILFLMMSQAFAGNPVLHFLDKPFPTKISTLGGSATSTYIFTNNLPFAFKNHFRYSQYCAQLLIKNALLLE